MKGFFLIIFAIKQYDQICFSRNISVKTTMTAMVKSYFLFIEIIFYKISQTISNKGILSLFGGYFNSDCSNDLAAFIPCTPGYCARTHERRLFTVVEVCFMRTFLSRLVRMWNELPAFLLHIIRSFSSPSLLNPFLQSPP